MNYGPLIFLAAFLGLSASWFGFVLTPQVQIGREQQATNTVNTAEMYPQALPGLANQGLEVYRENGCVYCHSQQVRQNGTAVNVLLSDAGTNATAVVEALLKANVGVTNADEVNVSGAPKILLRDTTVERAKAAVTALNGAGAKASVELQPLGPDIARGWGTRRTVAADYLYEHTVFPGSQRVGPDLANVALRLPDANWQLRHLYSPAAEVSGSPMPAYKFLFEERKLEPGQRASGDAILLNASGEFFDPAKNNGPAVSEIIPKPEAKALVAYLLSRRAETPLFVAPMTPPPAANNSSATNTPAATAATGSTNAPAK